MSDEGRLSPPCRRPQKGPYIGADSLGKGRHRIESWVLQSVLDFRDVVLPDPGRCFDVDLREFGFYAGLAEIRSEEGAHVLRCLRMLF
jgi:hypothetical protein